jgi:hypothetical protein
MKKGIGGPHRRAVFFATLFQRKFIHVPKQSDGKINITDVIDKFLKSFTGEENRKEYLFCGYLYIQRSTCA